MVFFYLAAVKSSSIGSGKGKRRPLSAHLSQPRSSAKPPPAFDTSKTKRQLDLIERDLKLTTKTLQDRLGISKQGFVWIKKRLPPCIVLLAWENSWHFATPDHGSFTHEMTFEERAQIFHLDDGSLPSTSSWHNQSDADLGCNTSSVWNFFAVSFRSTPFPEAPRNFGSFLRVLCFVYFNFLTLNLTLRMSY